MLNTIVLQTGKKALVEVARLREEFIIIQSSEVHRQSSTEPFIEVLTWLAQPLWSFLHAAYALISYTNTSAVTAALAVSERDPAPAGRILL